MEKIFKPEIPEVSVEQLENNPEKALKLMEFMYKYGFIKKGEEPPYGFYQVAQLEDEIVGFLRSRAVNQLTYPPNIKLDLVHVIEDILVDPEHRGKGIGRKLVENIENLFVEAGFPIDKLYAKGLNKKFWEAIGYEPIREGVAIFKKVQNKHFQEEN